MLIYVGLVWALCFLICCLCNQVGWFLLDLDVGV